MKKVFKKWRGGAEVSEVSILLPFVQITLKPQEEMDKLNLTDVHANEIPPYTPIIDFSVEVNNTELEAAVKRDLIKVELANRVANEVSGHKSSVHSYLSPDSWTKWRHLTGKVEFFRGDIVWFALIIENKSNKVLHNIPIRFGQLPLVYGLPGILTTSNKINQVAKTQKNVRIEQINNVADGTLIQFLNPQSANYQTRCVLHCFCRVPLQLTTRRNLHFYAFKSNYKDNDYKPDGFLQHLYHQLRYSLDPQYSPHERSELHNIFDSFDGMIM